MGNGGSHPGGGPGAVLRQQPAHWHHSLPTDPVLKASHLKVLPDLNQNPRLRSTNNGAILQSGGTISGKRPLSLALPHEREQRSHRMSNGVYRSKSISKDYEPERSLHQQQQHHQHQHQQPRFSYLSNQRDPLHRSHTHLHLDEPPPEDTFASQSKRFGSEPDLRGSGGAQEPPVKTKVVKNSKKKYKAPPPPHIQNDQGGSSPDSWAQQRSYEAPQPPSRKLRLFKTRAETKKTSANARHNHDVQSNGYLRHHHTIEEDFKPMNDIPLGNKFGLDIRRRDEYVKYPDNRDMVQSQMSLKREENILQTAFSRQEQARSRQHMYRERSAANTTNSKFDPNSQFRSSERFKKQQTEQGVLRREKSFDASLVQESGVSRLHQDRQLLLEDRRKFSTGATEEPPKNLKDKMDEASAAKKQAAPNRLSAEFQAELMKATRKLRAVGGDSTKTPEKSTTTPTKSAVSKSGAMMTLDRSKQVKSKKDSPAPRVVGKQLKDTTAAPSKIPQKIDQSKASVEKVANNRDVANNKNHIRESRGAIADRGQASGKESTPDQSPSRIRPELNWDRSKLPPNKSFYFGMDKDGVIPDDEEEMDPHEKVRLHLEMNYKNFGKVNGYHDEDFVPKNVVKNDYDTRLELPPGSPESALSSSETPEDDDDDVLDAARHGIALRLRPTLPKKQLEIPRFSPAAAWRLLSALETEVEQMQQQHPHHHQQQQQQQPIGDHGVRRPSTRDDEDEGACEERIRRSSRAGGHQQQHHDRSGDSGISGDAGPTHDDCCVEDDVEAPTTTTTTPSSTARKDVVADLPKRPHIAAWTPQQDLEEEESSSSDAGVDSPRGSSANADSGAGSAPAKYSARQQVFSLSLPRDAHLDKAAAASMASPLDKVKTTTPRVHHLHHHKSSSSTNHHHRWRTNPNNFERASSSSSKSASLCLDYDCFQSKHVMQQPFNSLQKLRKSIGVALGSKRLDADAAAAEEGQAANGGAAAGEADDNWFLSRSAPNSLNNGLSAGVQNIGGGKSNDSGQHQTPPSSDQEDDRMPPVMPSIMRPQPPFSYLATGGHVMYLPQYDSQRQQQQQQQHDSQPYSMSYHHQTRREQPHSQPPLKDAVPQMRQKSTDGNLSDDNGGKHEVPRDGRLMSRSKSSGELIPPSRNSASKQPRSKGKRFTFQSTVRQIERRRLAERLSKEAETKERQRLSELEAMRRVEEEFQRKRAREKASIRQQLRLVSLDESCSSLPSSWGGAQSRVEPEGAHATNGHSGGASPSPPSAGAPLSRRRPGGARASDASSGSEVAASPHQRTAPATRVLSEYRQDTREYRDYRRRPPPASASASAATPPLHHPHPPACYNMPPAHRNGGGGGGGGGWSSDAANDSDNYRREFARGRRAPSSSGSDLSQGRLLTPPRSSGAYVSDG